MSLTLHDRALECAKHYKQSEKELLDVLAELDRSKFYLTLGFSSLFRYCVETLCLSEAETMRFTQVCRKSEEVPALKMAIAEGTLTVSKASRIAPVISHANQELWIEKAKTLSHRELERAVANERPKLEPKERVVPLSLERSELRVTISLALERKLDRLREVLRTRNYEETLERMADFVLKHKDPLLKANGTNKPHADEGQWSAKGGGTAKGQGPVKAKGPTKAKSSELPPAPATRQVPPSLRRELFHKQGASCGYRNCGERRWLDLHHVRPVSMGGTHAKENLVLLCHAHHQMMHHKTRRT